MFRCRDFAGDTYTPRTPHAGVYLVLSSNHSGELTANPGRPCATPAPCTPASFRDERGKARCGRPRANLPPCQGAAFLVTRCTYRVRKSAVELYCHANQFRLTPDRHALQRALWAHRSPTFFSRGTVRVSADEKCRYGRTPRPVRVWSCLPGTMYCCFLCTVRIICTRYLVPGTTGTRNLPGTTGTRNLGEHIFFLIFFSDEQIAGN